RMRACGWGDRRRRAKAIRGSTRSSANTVWPVTLAAASTLTSGCPMTLRSFRSCSGTRRLRPHPVRRQLDRLEYLQVARATAEVPRGRLRDLLARGRGLVPEQGGGGEQEPRGAVAALRRPERREGFLERMQVRPGHALDGGDLTVTALHGQGEAGEDGASVHEHRAGAAFP